MDHDLAPSQLPVGEKFRLSSGELGGSKHVVHLWVCMDGVLGKWTPVLWWDEEEQQSGEE